MGVFCSFVYLVLFCFVGGGGRGLVYFGQMLRHKLLVLIMPHSPAFLDHFLADIHLHVANVVEV